MVHLIVVSFGTLVIVSHLVVSGFLLFWTVSLRWILVMASTSSDSSRAMRSRTITPARALKAGGIRIWVNALTASARVVGCAAAIPRNYTSLLAVPLTSVKREAGGADPSGDSSDDTPLDKLKGPAVTEAQQGQLVHLLYHWTDDNDWTMFDDLDNDDPELGTKMFLCVLRKYMGMGSHPIGEYLDEMREKQRDDETSVECYERIKRAAHALECAGRPQPLVNIFDSLVRALPSEHMHWLNTIDGTTIDRDSLDKAVWEKGSFIDRSQSAVSKSEKSAFAAKADTAASATQQQIDAPSAKFDGAMAAFAAHGGRGGRGGGRGGRGGRGRGGGRGTCNYCKEPGHWKNECPKLKEKNGGSGGGPTSDGGDFESALVAGFIGLPAVAQFNRFSVLAEPDSYDSCDDLLDDSSDTASSADEPPATGTHRSGRVISRIDPTEMGWTEIYLSCDLVRPPFLSEDSCVAGLPWDYLAHEHVDPVANPEILDWQYDPQSGMYYNSLHTVATGTYGTSTPTTDDDTTDIETEIDIETETETETETGTGTGTDTDTDTDTVVGYHSEDLVDPPALSGDSCLSRFPWDYLSHEHVDPCEYPEILDWKYDPQSEMLYNSLHTVTPPDSSGEICITRRKSGDSRRGRPAVLCPPATVTIESFEIPDPYTVTWAPAEPASLSRPPCGLSHIEKAKLRQLRRQDRHERALRVRSRQHLEGSRAVQESVASEIDSDSDDGYEAASSGFDLAAFDYCRLVHRAAPSSPRAGRGRGSPVSRSCFLRMARKLSDGDWIGRNGHIKRSSKRPAAFPCHLGRQIMMLRRLLHGHLGLDAGAHAYVGHSPGAPLAATKRTRRQDCVVDSGASRHFTAVKSDFSQLSLRSLGTVSGISVPIEGVGKVPIRLRNKAGKLMGAVLDQVYYTPGLSQRSAGNFDRLLSVRQATDGGCTFCFGSHGDSMSTSSGDDFDLVRDSGLVWLPYHSATPAAPQASAAPSQVLVTKQIFHRRCCHLHDAGLQKLVSLGVSGIPTARMADPLPFCKCCAMGKSTQADVNRSSTRDRDPDTCFHTMAADIWGPMHTKAIGGYIWVLGAVCFKSAYTLAELMKSKAEAPVIWKRFLLKSRSLGYSVVILRVDNDSVLLSKDFMPICDEFSIVLQRTAPYRHHQLARIERQWRTIAEAVVALLNDSGLATRFWGYAFLVIVYVRNRVWSSGAACNSLRVRDW